jgi:signal transduction histidine kinase/CheY-like chemotaxis protein/HPt (histidine-containing phosphotransfer) domain-containing protein
MGSEGTWRKVRTGAFFCLLSLLCLFPLQTANAATPFQLTDQEYTFIISNPQIRIGIDPEFVPFEFINNAGAYAGIASDVVALVSEITGLWFSPVLNLTWVEVVEKARRKEIDVLPAVGITDERLQYLQFTRPYITFQRTLVVKNTNTSINTFEDLFGRQVAVQTDSSHHGLLMEYPQIGIREYPTVEEALLAVNRGEEVAFLGNEATTSYIARSKGLTELIFIPVENGGNLQLHFAVRDDWPLMVSILDKALASIPEDRFTEIFNRWITYERRVDYREIISIAISIGLVVLIVLGISTFWILRLRNEIKRKEQAQREMEVAKAKAEAADLEKSRFMARMSHEIRTPLNGINGMTYLLERTKLDATQRRFLHTIGQSTRSMLSIINDILDYSRIEERKITLEHVGFNLDTVLHQVLSIDAWTIKEKNLNISLERGASVPVHLVGDPNRLAQILTNLIHNAVKFTAQGGIKVLVTNPKLDLSRCYLELAIRDTGMGMSVEHMAGLFKPFSQADESIARRFGGSGLGLSIVKSLVDLMGGTIVVESELGKGSAFIVTLPFALDVQGEAEDRKRYESVDFTVLSALLVIQNEDLLRSVSAIMTSYGVRTDRISSQRTALPLLMGTDAEASNYNLLIMDAPTWKERPVKILDALKGMNARPTHVKTILLLKNEEDSTGIDLATSEVDYVLPQPLIPSILFNALLELFPMRNASPTQSTEPLSPTKPDKSYRVLVVEDNPTNQIIALEVLTQAGFQVVIASNGRKGVDRFLQSIQHMDAGDGIERFDVILMDLHMDVMDGYEATRLIREQDSHIPIIATTADILDSVRDRCAVSGVTTVVCKPYNPDELIAKIVEVIERGIQQVLDGAGSGGASAIGAIDFDDAIKRLGGDRALYAKVVDSFLVEHTRLSCQLNDQVAKGSSSEAVNTAHTLKGGCGTIGAYAAQKIAAGLQMELENGPSDRLSDLMKRFNHEFTLVISDAKRWRAREKQTS